MLTSSMTVTGLTENDPRWAHVCARDASQDGAFVYSVETTGVYCRPSCAARRANPKNVRFHATPALAEAAGFRACKRCRPVGPTLADEHARLVTRACRQMEATLADGEPAPSLATLAAPTGMTATHFHRVFKAVAGVTPRAYAAALRSRRVKAELGDASSVTAALYAAGYGSSGRFYEGAAAELGMTPTAWRQGGAGSSIRFALGVCSLGEILVAASAQGVCAIFLGDDADELLRALQRRFAGAELVGGDADFERVVAAAVGMVDDPAQGFALPLDVRGTAFQRRVWQALSEVPVGSTTSYSELARRIGAPKAARAVASACANNVLAVAIPCHRVVRADGGLSGYRWGIARKQALLQRERGE